MKKSKLTPKQLTSILRGYELGKDVATISTEHALGKTTFYKWRQRYAGMDASDLKRLKEPEAENAKLKRM